MVSYIHSYQVRNTLLRINYLTSLVSTMAPSSFGPYHGHFLYSTSRRVRYTEPKNVTVEILMMLRMNVDNKLMFP